MSLTPPNTATATALVAAHGVVDSALADVRTRHAALDKQVRHWVDGTTRSAYHPHHKRGFRGRQRGSAGLRSAGESHGFKRERTGV